MGVSSDFYWQILSLFNKTIVEILDIFIFLSVNLTKFDFFIKIAKYFYIFF